MLPAAPPLLDSFTALADPTRCRMMLLLEQHELTVSELCVVLQLPQSTVSRHLKLLGDAGLVASRREGTSRYYSLEKAQGPGPRAQGSPQAALWQLARTEFMSRPAADQDARRLSRVLRDRSATSREFFATVAGQWDQLRADLFGDQFYFRALLGLLPASWVVADLGCGTGAVSAALSPHVAKVIGVDASDDMLQAAAARSGRRGPALSEAEGNIELRQGSLEALPIDSASVDAATLVLVLHHVAAPAAALEEAARVLRPGGRVLIVDMASHEREEYRQRMGHVWMGFSEDHVRRLLEQAGFTDIHYHALPVVTEVKGPALFAASAARKPEARSQKPEISF